MLTYLVNTLAQCACIYSKCDMSSCRARPGRGTSRACCWFKGEALQATVSSRLVLARCVQGASSQRVCVNTE